MKKLLFACGLIACSLPVLSQINTQDSSVQVVGYWDKGEKMEYMVSFEKYKVKGTDTTSREKINYEVDVVIKDSTEKSYTISWLYKNFNISSDNDLTRKLLSLGQNMEVVIKTDELGTFSEVVNWKEIRDYIHKATNEVRQQFKSIPEMDKVIKQLEGIYSTREAIESASIKDIQQFYTFHGAKYNLGEVLEGTVKVPNILGGEQLDSDVRVYLDEINKEDDNYILRSSEAVNPEQLTEATYKYLVEMYKELGKEPPGRDVIKGLKSEITTDSRIHATGWVIYSIQNKTVVTEDQTNIEERVIELKD